MEKGRRSKGFTLAELLIVVAIIAVLVAIAIPVFTASIERSRETVCLNNRTALQHELVYEQMSSDVPLTQPELQAIADASGIACPTKERLTVTARGEGNLEITVDCPTHSLSIPQKTGDRYKDMVDNFDKYVPYFNNDLLRKEYYKQNGNAWSVLQVEGTDYYIQPYVNKDDPDRQAWVYAGPGQTPDAANKWATYFIYEPDERRWYQCVDNKGQQSNTWISRFTTSEDVRNFIHGTYSNGQPQCVPLGSDYQELPPGG